MKWEYSSQIEKKYDQWCLLPRHKEKKSPSETTFKRSLLRRLPKKKSPSETSKRGASFGDSQRISLLPRLRIKVNCWVVSELLQQTTTGLPSSSVKFQTDLLVGQWGWESDEKGGVKARSAPPRREGFSAPLTSSAASSEFSLLVGIRKVKYRGIFRTQIEMRFPPYGREAHFNLSTKNPPVLYFAYVDRR